MNKILDASYPWSMTLDVHGGKVDVVTNSLEGLAVGQHDRVENDQRP